MKLIVAGITKEYDEGISVARLLELEKVETPQYVTVSVNDDFISTGDFDRKRLQEGDSVEFLYFMGGGF